jgi:hypothetical protein
MTRGGYRAAAAITEKGVCELKPPQVSVGVTLLPRTALTHRIPFPRRVSGLADVLKMTAAA